MAYEGTVGQNVLGTHIRHPRGPICLDFKALIADRLIPNAHDWEKKVIFDDYRYRGFMLLDDLSC